MVQLDTRLPLMVQQPNVLAALDAGTQAAANQASVMRQAEGQNIFRQYGAGAMQGDQNALAKIASFDPMMGQTMDFNRQENARADARLGIAREQLDMARAETARAVKEAQDKADAAKQVEMMKTAFKAMDVGMRSGDMRAVSQGLRMFGLQDLTPEEGMQVAAQMVAGGVEGLAATYLPKPTEYAVANGAYYDKNNPGAGATPIPGMPADQPLVDMSNSNFGPQGPGVTDKFYEKLDAAQADMFGAILSNGMTVPSRIAQLDEMQAIMSRAPAGAEAGIKVFAGNYGIETDGLSDLQAAQALVNRLVPAQRPPGSGPMSDADLELFKQSLPRLINTREGNLQIIATLRGIAIYEMQQAEIAQRVASRQITPAEGVQELSRLQNPLAAMRKPGATTIGGYTIREVTE